MTEKDQQDIKGALGAVLFALIAPFIIVWLMYYINTPSWQRWYARPVTALSNVSRCIGLGTDERNI